MPKTPTTNAPAAPSLDLLAGEPDLAVVTLDPELQVLTANPAARRIYLPAGRADERLEGRQLAGLYPSPFGEDVQRLRRLHREHGGPLLVRGIWRGHRVHTSVHAWPPGGTPGGSHPQGKGGGLLLLGRRGEPGGGDAVPTDHLRVDAGVIDLGELSTLTPRELEVLALLGSGGTLKDAAESLRRSVKTVESHRDNIARKLGLSRRGELVRVVERSGLRPSDVGVARLVLDEPAQRASSLGAATQNS